MLIALRGFFIGIISRIPIVRTLAVCTREGRQDARIELLWQIGIALFSIVAVGIVVLFSEPPEQFFDQIYPLISRGELMVYAAALCGGVLYSLRHGIKTIPDAIAAKVTPVGSLMLITGALMLVAMATYVVRRMGDLHHIKLNDGLLYGVSWVLLLSSIIVAYVVFALKHSLVSGYSTASREQTGDFAAMWQQAGRDAD